MQLTKGVEQAACILIFLATQESSEPLSTDEISKRLEVSPSYLKKITRKLVVKNIITSVSGNKGGIALARKLEDITLLDVIEAIEEISIFPDTGLINLVFKGGKNAEKGTDLLRNVFKKADELLIHYFSGITLAELLKKGFGTDHLPVLNWNTTSLTEYLQQQERGE
ncbi:RrF2 family transcriptional regulator [Bacillus sp. PS06]|uniref:RrF2 family transcriptional regulator n=1 Tax=Bacillus sp. PS06 TaxID=2764176 RepID=UPI0017839A70|nr:Rrf2 family transcriptional regulator [Bacillus sp. PS06]MBD8070047.1 Rrf2 family transcriptional regulator [Bacillus sp. PS06]